MKRTPAKSSVSVINFTFPTPYRMKTLKCSRFFLSLLMLTGFVFGSLSCENASPVVESAPKPAVADAKIARLVKDGIRQSTPEEIDAWITSYKALNFQELEQFGTLLNEYELKKAIADASNSNARISQTQVASIAAEYDKIASYRNEVNQLSMKEYGVPYNQLESSALDSVFSQADNHFSIDLMTIQTGNSTKGAKTSASACPPLRYPYVAYVTNGGNVSHSLFSGISSYDHPDDCDVDVMYYGVHYNFSPRNPLSKSMCDAFNNRIARRFLSSRTFLLFGQNRFFAFGGYGAFDVDMY